MYIGRYYYTVEMKGRIAVPAAFRTQLGDSPIVTRGLDGCLFLFSQLEWHDFASGIDQVSITKKNHRDFSRLMANDASVLEYDAQGRVLIPDYLKFLANLKKDVVFAGSVNKVEVWDQTTYHKYMDVMTKNAEEVAENFVPSSAKKVDSND